MVRSKKGSILSRVFFFCLSADCLKAKLTPYSDPFMTVFGHPCTLRRSLKLGRHSSNVIFEEFVLSSLIASPFIKTLFTPGGWQEVKCVY